MTHRSSHTHCQVAQAATQAKTWQRVCLPKPEKIELNKFPFPSENKKYTTAQPNDRQKSVAKQTPKPLTGKRFNYSVDRRPACNSTYPKGGVSCPKDSFVVNQTLVFQIKFCGKSPALRVPANRWL
jgi:hypothetical protein